MPKVIATLNQKGGVGKTTISFHLAHAALGLGQSVLLVDLDTQRNSTLTVAGFLPEGDAAAAHQIFTAPDLASFEPLVTDSGIHLLYGTKRLDVLDSSYTPADAIARTDFVRSLPYDVILFDTPPALSLRLLAPLLWADTAVVPVQPNAYSVQGLADTLDAIRRAQRANPRLRSELVINLHDLRKGSYRETVERLAAIAPFRGPVLTDRVAVTNAMSARVPVWRYQSADRETRSTWKSYFEGLVA